MASLIPIVILFVLMYMLLIRPQQQRVRKQRDLIGSLEVGDRIVTVGGLVGTILSLDAETAEIEAADGVVLTFIRPAISRKADLRGPAPVEDGLDEDLDNGLDGGLDDDAVDHPVDVEAERDETPEVGA